MLDPELTSLHHINLVVCKCYYQLHQLWLVFHSLIHQSRHTIVHAFVTSCIDRCCSLLAWLPLGTLARLDRVLRSAAHLVGGAVHCLDSWCKLWKQNLLQRRFVWTFMINLSLSRNEPRMFTMEPCRFRVRIVLL